MPAWKKMGGESEWRTGLKRYIHTYAHAICGYARQLAKLGYTKFVLVVGGVIDRTRLIVKTQDVLYWKM